MSIGKILIVDDEENQRLFLKAALESFGFETAEARDGAEALEKLRFQQFDIAITDMQMPRMTGVELVERSAEHGSTASLIVVTAHGTIETAVEAMKKGAEDYLLKPIELGELEIALERIMQKRRLLRDNLFLQSENQLMKRELGIRYHTAEIIGKTPATLKLLEQIREHSKDQRTVLILGEPGTGKDDLARMIHFNGPWAEMPLVCFDCIDVPDELHARQLFGEEATSDSGVKRPSVSGLIERAYKGTLAISNVHRLDKGCQASLVRVLREKKVQRAGGSRFYPVDVRLIATSERKAFDQAVRGRTLKADLHGVIQANVIEVPPLRERREDLLLFVAALAKKAGSALGKNIEKVNRDVSEALAGQDFPGNIGELSAMVEAAVIRCSSEELSGRDFSPVRR